MEDKELLAEEESSFITLTDENGVDMEFEFMECIEYQGRENENYISVEDEAVLEAVYAIFKDHFKDILTFED